MRNNGFSLIEVTIIVSISALIGLAITFNFVIAHHLRCMTEDNVAISREVRIAMNHMTRVLRFAKPDTLDDTVENQISATIEGGHLDFIASADADIVYEYIPENKSIEYTQDENPAIVIAGGGEREIDITFLKTDWEGNGGIIDSAESADAGASVKFTCADEHALSVNDNVILADFALATTYNGVHAVTDIDDEVTFTIELPWDQDDDGTFVTTKPRIKIQLTAEKGDRSVSILTKINPLGK
ncbi:MAG: hypothetical protein JSV93_03505 [Candidatus Omnitrophota bacterium]|nr:MAG: hypothetical protein JSV93_03505 [Candidatus Omnitrophota bacterium]